MDAISVFEARATKGASDECWPWTGGRNSAGYGRLFINRGCLRVTHLSLEASGFPRPDGAHALHSCDNPSCVNPAHLRWGSNIENVRDKVIRGRQPHGARVRGAKLDETSVKAIRSDPRPHEVIADEYGVDRSVVGKVKSGRLWRRVSLADGSMPRGKSGGPLRGSASRCAKISESDVRLKFALWWERVGRHLGAFPNPNDREYLDAVWKGHA